MHIDFILVLNTLLILGAALISPGPDFFLVLKNSLRYGKRSGIITGIGIATGCFISFTIVVVGVSFLFKYPLIKQVMNVVCGAYLSYIGIKCILSKSHHSYISEQAESKTTSELSLFISGLLTNIFNPKLYSLTTGIMAYVENNHPSKLTNISIIILQGLMALVWFTLVARLFSTKNMQDFYFKKESIINKILGVIFIAVAIGIVIG